MVFCAIYTSRPTARVASLSGLQVLEILETSRRNNAAAEITGVLFCNARTFVQVLEGPEQSVSATLTRIVADNRHFDVKVLWRGTVAERLFPGWYMRSVEGAEGTHFRFDSVAADELDPTELHELVTELGGRPSARWLGDHPPRPASRKLAAK